VRSKEGGDLPGVGLGSETLSSSSGVEAPLRLAADDLSNTQPPATFWRECINPAAGQRHYQAAG
jgi:hypothetical protein